MINELSDEKPPFPVKAVSYPDSVEIGREGPAGMMTLILLTRKTALTDSQFKEIKNILLLSPQEMPAPADATIQKFLYLDGRLEESLSDKSRQPLEENHPVQTRLRQLVEKLNEHFPRIEAVSFAVPEL